MIGPNGEQSTDKATAQIYVNLVPKGERNISQSEFASQIRAFGTKMSGVDFYCYRL